MMSSRLVSSMLTINFLRRSLFLRLLRYRVRDAVLVPLGGGLTMVSVLRIVLKPTLLLNCHATHHCSYRSMSRIATKDGFLPNTYGSVYSLERVSGSPTHLPLLTPLLPLWRVWNHQEVLSCIPRNAVVGLAGFVVSLRVECQMSRRKRDS